MERQHISKVPYSLAQLGITSINLNANTTNIVLPDSSSIDGETTYTTSSGDGELCYRRQQPIHR